MSTTPRQQLRAAVFAAVSSERGEVMSKKLKPCPFCGSDDVICDMFEDVYFVECWDCCAKVESYNGLEDAVAGWNARANKEGE